jgi:hypothetical protein
MVILKSIFKVTEEEIDFNTVMAEDFSVIINVPKTDSPVDTLLARYLAWVNGIMERD